MCTDPCSDRCRWWCSKPFNSARRTALSLHPQVSTALRQQLRTLADGSIEIEGRIRIDICCSMLGRAFENDPNRAAAVDFTGLDDGDHVAGRSREFMIVGDDENRPAGGGVLPKLAAKR